MHLLVYIGLTHRTDDGTWFVPFKAPPRHTWKFWYRWPRLFGWAYVFRNTRCTARIPGRLLPWRWGFGVCGFEFGDRGSLRYSRCPHCFEPLHQFKPESHQCKPRS